jgi:hypothetical protein
MEKAGSLLHHGCVQSNTMTERRPALKQFLEKHRDKIVGTVSCFDRIIFKGYLPFTYPAGMAQFLKLQGVPLTDFKPFVLKQAERLKQHARRLAHSNGRPYTHLYNYIRKENLARSIAQRRGVTEGLICVLSAVEPCGTFRLVSRRHVRKLVWERRKCLFLYYYWLDPELGLFHIRIQTWFPFTVQVYLNGHDWLARQLDRRGLRYRRLDNAFVWLQNPKRSQRTADRLVRRDWPRILDRLARRVNPLLRDLLKGLSYYWVIDQAEYATDVVFKNRPALRELYRRLVRHATLYFGCEDVLSFLGKKLHPQFGGELGNDLKRRIAGTRVKHRVGENWIKMYDKHGLVLRIETVINRSRMFKVYRRHTKRDGTVVLGWQEMNKGVSNLYRYAEVSRAANQRYLAALAAVDDPAAVKHAIYELARPARHNGRKLRAFNPASREDVALFAAVLKGEHNVTGLRNKNIRRALFGPSKLPSVRRKHSARVSRLLKRLHIHRLIAKVPRTRRWRVTERGFALMSLAVRIHEDPSPDWLTHKAA